MGRSIGRWIACAAALVVCLTPSASAQARRIDLTLTGGPLLFPVPTAADFAAGFALHPTGLTFLVDLDNRGSPNAVFETTVTIRGTSAVLGGNGKPLSDLEWSLGSTAGPWASLTTSDALVDSRTVQKNGANDPWGNTLHFRMRLGWTRDAPATYSTGVVVTITVTGA